jgi:serine protease AprX
MEKVNFRCDCVRIVILLILLSLIVSVSYAGTPDITTLTRISSLNVQKDEAKSLAQLPSDATVRVIVTLNDKATDAKIAEIQKYAGSFKTERKGWTAVLPNSFAATMSKEQIVDLQKNPAVKEVRIDKKVSIMLETANFWSGATKARAAAPTGFGVNGDRDGKPYTYSKTDVVIAIVDTGIDPMHVDLNGTDNGGTSKVIGWYDAYNGYPYAYDDNGHGTHVASIAAGEGNASSRYKGVAPGAALVGVKVLSSGGYGYESDVVEGVNWVVTNKNTYGIKIMSLSLGSSGSSDGTDPLSVAVNKAVNAGIVVTVAAGNAGPQKYTIGSPAAASKVITVAAMDDPGYKLKVLPAASSASSGNAGLTLPEEKAAAPMGMMDIYANNGFYLAPFSSRGPTADNRMKPDVAAPGVMITAAKNVYPNTPKLHGNYIEMSGTSMSTPFVAGVAALMLDANYTLTPAQVKTKITETAEDYGMTGTDLDYGAGRIRAYRAVNDAKTGLNSATGDQWVPTHLRSAGSFTDTSYYLKEFPLPVTDDNYPVACTLIMYDWSGWDYGIDLDLYIINPMGTTETYSSVYERQETAVTAPSNLGKYNATIRDYIGSGRYSLDCSYK